MYVYIILYIYIGCAPCKFKLATGLNDQTNICIWSGVHPSLHKPCHPQTIACVFQSITLLLPPYIKRIWYYGRACINDVSRSIAQYQWRESFNR